MSSASFQKALPFVLRWEGGFVNHPADPGGATNKGVTQKVYSEWLAQEGRPDADVRNLPDADMQAIYEERYWEPARCEVLPAALAQVQFDTAVNMGVGRAVRFLQQAVGAAVDGAFGPGTLKSVQAADPAQTLARCLDIREAFYRDLVVHKPESGVFLNGWLNRLNALRAVVAGLESVEDDEAAATEHVADAESAPAELREQAAALRDALAGDAAKGQRRQVAPLLLKLRNAREWAALRGLAEALLRIDPAPPTVWRLYAQALIEDGALVPAIWLLRALAERLPHDHPEFGEAWGLTGRVHKQRFADLAAGNVELRQQALGDAISAYEVPYRADPVEHTWHGVNLLAAVARARREGWASVGASWDVAALASQLTNALLSKPADDWTLPTLAEVALAHALASGNLGLVEAQLKAYLTAEGTQSFHVASTLRQFVEIWQLDRITLESPGHALRTAAAVQQARNLLDVLRARLLSLPKGSVAVPLTLNAQVAEPSRKQLEAVLGDDGPRTFAWYRAGVDAANSVAVIRRRLGKRFGTGFLVRAGDLGLTQQPDELLLMTNFHVVNPNAVGGALKPQDAEVLFEARDTAKAYAVKDVVWNSPVDQHDCCLLRLAELPQGVKPLAVSMDLPALPAPGETKKTRVYIIGHPGGGELAISLDDNELLDHEGPPGGIPPDRPVQRVHYRAPTKGGSSGSPVFEENAWQVVALHHAGGTLQQLNEKPGDHEANEGLALGPLARAAVAAT